MKPSKHREVWMVAAASLLLTASLQVPRALRAHFGDVPAPAPSYYRPGVPYEAFSYTKQTVAAEPQPYNSNETPKRTGKRESQPPMVHSGKVALAALNRPSDSQNSASSQSANVLHIAHIPSSNK